MLDWMKWLRSKNCNTHRLSLWALPRHILFMSLLSVVCQVHSNNISLGMETWVQSELNVYVYSVPFKFIACLNLRGVRKIPSFYPHFNPFVIREADPAQNEKASLGSNNGRQHFPHCRSVEKYSTYFSSKFAFLHCILRVHLFQTLHVWKYVKN